jgi:hypothetical protein
MIFLLVLLVNIFGCFILTYKTLKRFKFFDISVKKLFSFGLLYFFFLIFSASLLKEISVKASILGFFIAYPITFFILSRVFKSKIKHSQILSFLIFYSATLFLFSFISFWILDLFGVRFTR